METSRAQLTTGIDDLLRGIFMRHLKRGHKPGDLDLTLGQVHCLRLIGRMGSPSMSDLSGGLDLQPSTITGLVDALVERGLVQRHEDPDDRRIVRVELTRDGRRRRDHHRRAVRERLMDLLGDLGDDDLRRIHEALSLLHDAALRRAEQLERESVDCERDENDPS